MQDAVPVSTKTLAAISGTVVFALTTVFQLLAALSALHGLLPVPSRGKKSSEPEHKVQERLESGPSGWALGRMYDILDFWWEVKFYAGLRPVICGDVVGEVLELGVGTGRNLPFYPPGAMVTGIDLSEQQISVAKQRAAEEELACSVRTLAVGNAASLSNVPDNSADVVISTFMFCVMPEELIEPTLSEVARVLRPGGTFRFADIQYSKKSALQRWIQAWYAPYVRFAFGAAFDGKIRQHLSAHKGLTLTRQTPLKGDTLWLLEGMAT